VRVVHIAGEPVSRGAASHDPVVDALPVADKALGG
jgi:hypothetical protein